MITIGFDASRAFTKDRTGTENYSYQLLKALAKIDRRNGYLVYLRPGNNIKTSEWPKNFQFSILNFQFLWTQGGLAWNTFRDDLDVLFVPAHTLPVIRKPGLKTVVTVHDLGAEYLPSMHQLKQRLYLNLMTHYQLKSATSLVAVSRATKDDLIKRVGIKANKISVVYEGFDKDLFKPVKNGLLVNSLKKFDLVSGSFFLFVGTIQPRKNLERVIKAFAKFLENFGRQSHSLARQHKRSAVAKATSDTLADAPLGLAAFGDSLPSLIIVGQKGWLSDEIYQLPKKLGMSRRLAPSALENRVKFLGYVSDKDLPALYSGAIALVFPSLFEGFGLPILEAQACGCPVITSNLSSMPEVAGDGAILVDPYSLDDIVKGMIRIKNQELRIKLVEAGFENVKRFSWEKCARETLNVLEGL